MNKFGKSVVIVIAILTALLSVFIAYIHSNSYLTHKIQEQNDTYKFDDDGNETITAKYAYKDGRLKVDLETSPLPGESPMAYYRNRTVVELKLLDKDKFDLVKLDVKGDDFSMCGNGGSYCATVTTSINGDEVLNTKSVDVSCDSGIFTDEEEEVEQALTGILEEASHMLY